jgi:serine/threonine protein kinase/tetratricopeptide (TPR) repeat protein
MYRGGVYDFLGTTRFEVRRQLGQGGMGVVYEAWDRERRLSVALKTLRDLDPSALYRLKNEFRSLRGLTHPNLVTLGELIEDAGRWFYTMELVVDGVDFLRWVRDEACANDEIEPVTWSADTMQSMRGPGAPVKPPPPVNYTQLRAALGQLAQGLSALHEAGKVHRDVKPSNVLVDGGGRLVLLDFGLVWDMARPKIISGRHVVGTPEYMAPEQATGQAVGPAADWYSVGVLLYESLVGRVPFAGTPLQVLMDKQQHVAPAPSELCEGVPADLEELACALLRFDPEARPSGRQVLRTLGVDPTVTRSYTSLITQSSVFVGREPEKERLAQAFAEVVAGECVSVAVCGESGLGKSTLVRHFVRELEESERATVLRSACYENELVPYTAVDGAMDDLTRVLSFVDATELEALLPRHVDLLARMFPVLLRLEAVARTRLLRTKAQADPHEQRARAFEALRRLLVDLGEQKPLVLVIDDVQWADLDSVRLLQRLLAPPAAPRLLVLVTSRTRAAALALPLVADARILDLQPLDPSAARDLSRALAARADSGATLGIDAIAVDAGGHPFLIQELVRYAAVSGRPTEGVRVDDAIRARAGELAPAAQRLLELLAVASAPLPQVVLRAASGLEPAEFNRQRAILCTVNLARIEASSRDTVGLYHSRVGDAIRGTPGHDPRRLHAQLAVAFESSGVAELHPELVVHHLEQAGEAQRAADYARRAAERAASKLAFEHAAMLCRTALRIGSFERKEIHELRMALGHALVYTGRGGEAAGVFLEAADHDDPVIQLDCRRLAAEQLLISGHVEKGLAVLERLLAEMGTPLPRTPAATVAGLVWQRLRLKLRGMSWKPRSATQVTRETVVHMDAHRATSHGLAMVDNIRGAVFNTRHLRLSLDGGDIARIGDALATEAVYFGVRGGRDLAHARTLAASATELGERSHDPRLQAFAVAVTGTLAYLAGHFRDAEAQLTHAEDLLAHVPAVTAWELNNCRLFQLFSLRFLGKVKRARALSDRYLDDARSRGDAYIGTSLGRTAVWVQLAAGRVAGARERLERATWDANSVWFQVQDYYQIEAQSQIALYEDEADAVYATLDTSFTRMFRSPMTTVQICRVIGRWQRASLALACRKMPQKQVLRTAREAARKNRREDISFAVPMTESLLAAIAHREGRLDDARDHYQKTIDSAEASAMSDFAAAARFRLGTLVGGDEGDALVAAARAWARSEDIPDDRFFDILVVRPHSK